MSFRNNFSLNNWQWGLDIGVRSKGNTNATYYNHPSWMTSLYVNKNFLHDKLQMNVRGNDIFKTSNSKITYSYNALSSISDDYMYRRSIVLEIRYRFNAVQNRYKGNRSTNELDRF
jgi:hypothetical protein